MGNLISSVKLIPGSKLPDVVLDKVAGSSINDRRVHMRSSSAMKFTLLLFYRGHFSPLCVRTLIRIQSKLVDIEAAGISVIAVSADHVDVATHFANNIGLTFTILAGLTEKNMHSLGLYVTDPRKNVARAHPFCEPGYILLYPDSTIKYIDISSHPFGGRIDLDEMLSQLSQDEIESASDPELKRVIWGSRYKRVCSAYSMMSMQTKRRDVIVAPTRYGGLFSASRGAHRGDS